MAADNFQKCLAFVLKYEGGKSDDLRDPGGRTMEGITQKSYDAYREKKGLPYQDVFIIPAPERDEIYRTEYWNAVNGDALRSGEDLCVFDLAVNSGPHRALQIWNQAGAAQAGLDDIIQKVCAIRVSFLQELRTWQYFGAGWSKRVAACRTSALNMARSGFSQIPTGAAAGAVGAVLMGIAGVIHYLQRDPHGPVLSLVIVATILLILCLFLSKPKIAATAVSALSPAEKLKDLLATRDAINVQIAELEAAVKSSIDEMTELLGKIHA